MGWNAVYGRISKDKEGRQEKVETQVEKGRAYALERWPDTPVKEYVDNDLTAADPNVFRPDYDRLLYDIRAGHVEHLICAEQSRLTRQPSEWEELVVVLSKNGIREVHQYRGGVVQVHGSKLIGRILAAVDAEEVERMRTRINERLGTLAEEGRPHGGRSFAYNYIAVNGRKHLEPDPERAPIVHETVDRLLARGWALSAVADDLNDRGVPTARGGKRWTPSSVRSMVLNPTVAGYRTHRGRLIPGTWEAIIPKDTWRALQHLLTAPISLPASRRGFYQASRSRAPRRRYLLTGGIAVCGVCDAPLAAQRRQNRDGSRTPIYACHPSKGGKGCVTILAEPMEAQVADELCKELDRPGFWDAYMADPGERAALLAKLGAIAERESETARRWGRGDLKPHEWEAARAVLGEERGGVESRLAALPPALVPVSGVELRKDWGRMPLAEKRVVVEAHVGSVVIDRGTPGLKKYDAGRVRVRFR